ncbi:MAG: hypothetical protein ACI91J_000084 [Yoonia sp.]|jgi:hypothetical protein
MKYRPLKTGHLALLFLLGLLSAANVSAQNIEEVMRAFSVRVLSYRTNVDHSLDYLRLHGPMTLRHQPKRLLSIPEARLLLPPLIVDDPDGMDAKEVDMATAPNPEPAAKDASDEEDPLPPPVSQNDPIDVKPAALHPAISVLAAPVEVFREQKVTVVESPRPPMAAFDAERRRRDRNTRLRSLVPFFLGNNFNNASRHVVTNNLVPFSPPQVSP